MIESLKRIGDIKFEWLAGYMMYYDWIQSLDHLGVECLGIFNRNTNFEIENIRKQHNTTIIEINRESLYDALPHGLFHKAKTYESYKMPTNLIKDEIKIEGEKEREARKFFSPFENEIYKLNVVAELLAREVATGFYGNSKVDFERLIPFDITIYDDNERIKLLLIMPIYRQLLKMQPTAAVKWMLEFVLDRKIVVSIQLQRSKYSMEKEIDLSVGTAILGWNSILGNDFSQWEDKLVVELHHEGEKDAFQLYMDDHIIQKAERIVKWIIPLNQSYEIMKQYKTKQAILNQLMLGMQLGEKINKIKSV